MPQKKVLVVDDDPDIPAGDWTATGLPATIESAVASGRNCARALLERIR